jgi:ankyrin repeat protein
VNDKLGKNSQNTIWTTNNSLNYEKLKLYLDYGAKINAKDDQGNTVLHNLVSSSHVANVKYLVDKGADVNIKNSDGQTVLHLAAQQNCIGNLELFIEKGCDVNLPDKDGNTPLLLAALANNEEGIEILVQKNAKTDVKNNEGKSLNEIAFEKGLKNSIDTLINPVKREESNINSESYKLNKLKSLIINKLKNGGKQMNYDKEGGSSVVYYDSKGFYVHTLSNIVKNYTYENSYKSDEAVLNFLYNQFKNINSNNMTKTYEYILNNIF